MTASVFLVLSINPKLRPAGGSGFYITSAVEQNTLNLDLDSDPECQINLDPDPGLCYKFRKKKK